MSSDTEGWSAADKFTVVLESAGLNATELSAYCRERGLFPEQVSRWRQAAQDANAKPVLTMAEQMECQQPPLDLHADNAMPSGRLLAELRGATLESRLEEMGVLRSFSLPSVSNVNPYTEFLFRTFKYRPDYPSWPFAKMVADCEWVAAFVDW